jgi:amyloid beta precursor protein binding protein 1
MKAQSDVYIKLQNIYKAKARQDADEVLKMVQASPGGRDVDPAEVELFCKNAAFVKLINASAGGAGDASVESSDRLATVTGKFVLWDDISLVLRERLSLTIISYHLHSATSSIPPQRVSNQSIMSGYT